MNKPVKNLTASVLAVADVSSADALTQIKHTGSKILTFSRRLTTKSSKLIASGLLFAGLSSAAMAVGNSDLILGFTASGGTGSTQSIEIDLGSVGSYVTVTGSGTNYSLGNLNAALTSVYGSSWSTRSDLTFGIIGAAGPSAGPNGQPASTVWASSATSSGAATAAPAWKTWTEVALSDANSKSSGIYNTFASGAALDFSSQTSALPGVTLTGYNNNATNTWLTGYATTFGLTNLGSSNHAVFYATPANGNRLDLYELQPSAARVNAVDLGYFTLVSDGSLSFTAIPEPSTYAAFLGLAALGCVMRRRSKEAVNA